MLHTTLQTIGNIGHVSTQKIVHETARAGKSLQLNVEEWKASEKHSGERGREVGIEPILYAKHMGVTESGCDFWVWLLCDFGCDFCWGVTEIVN